MILLLNNNLRSTSIILIPILIQLNLNLNLTPYYLIYKTIIHLIKYPAG